MSTLLALAACALCCQVRQCRRGHAMAGI